MNTPIAVLLQDGEAASDIDSMKAEPESGNPEAGRGGSAGCFRGARPGAAQGGSFRPGYSGRNRNGDDDRPRSASRRDGRRMRANEDVFVMGEEVAEYQGRLQGQPGPVAGIRRAPRGRTPITEHGLPASASARR